MSENNNREYSQNSNKKVRAPPVKIAYYVQNMAGRKTNSIKVILAIMSQFDKRDIMQFARKYRRCFNNEDVRHIANMIYSIPMKNIERSARQLLDTVV